MKLKGLYQKSDTKIWYFQPPQKKGTRVKPISLKTKDREKAIEEYLRLKPEVEAELQPSLASFEAARYLSAKTAERTHRGMSARNAKTCLHIFREHLGDRMVHTYTAEEIKAWGRDLMEEGKTTSTVKTYLAHVAAFFSWLHREGVVHSNVMESVKLPKVKPTKAERYCTKDERDFLLRAVMAESPDLAFLVWTGFMAGFRLLEIVEARTDWFDLAGGVVHVKDTPTFRPKNAEVRQIPMSGRYRQFLEWYGVRSPFMLRPEKPHGAWRYRVETRKWVEAFTVKHGMEWVSPHIMRHTFATLHIMAGTPLGVVSKWLGNQYRTTERVYVGYVRTRGHQDATD